MKLIPKVNSKTRRDDERRSKLYRELLRREAKIGGELFGAVPQGVHREFFRLDAHTWIWHEEWVDAHSRTPRVVTTRYDIRPNGVLKSQNDGNFQYIDTVEARRLQQAIRQYKIRVSSDVYGVAV